MMVGLDDAAQVAADMLHPEGQAMMALLDGLLQRALADAHALTQHPSAVGARFRLLGLALKHAKYARVRGVVPLAACLKCPEKPCTAEHSLCVQHTWQMCTHVRRGLDHYQTWLPSNHASIPTHFTIAHVCYANEYAHAYSKMLHACAQAHVNATHCPLALALLYERVLGAALSWFSAPIAYFGGWSPSDAR